VTAIRGGQSIDTTMGYAPGSGLIMGSRAGDVDTDALLTLMQSRNLKPIDAQTYLQSQGGLKGIAGEADLRLLLDRRSHNDESATLAVDSFVYQIKKAIGAYVAVLGGLDALVFTATAGERSAVLRELITSSLADLGVIIDTDKNDFYVSKGGVISTKDSRVTAAVIKTDEAGELLRQSDWLLSHDNK
jgi:acetate kinase